MVDSLNNIRKEFRQEALNLSASSDDLGKVMKPRQIANLLLAVEQVYLYKEHFTKNILQNTFTKDILQKHFTKNILKNILQIRLKKSILQ